MNRTLLLVAAASLSACGTAASRNPAVIIPYAGGVTVATATGRSEEVAMHKALQGARMECDDRRQPLAVTKTTTAFRGVIAPEVSQTVSKVGKVIEGTTGTPAPVPDLSSDDDYKVSVEFRCENPETLPAPTASAPAKKP